MIFSKAFRDFMASGKKPTEAIAEDASVDLVDHDARFHGGHYDGKGSCKYREALAKGDKADDLAKAERAEEKAKAGGEDAANAPTPQDYADLADIRDRLERVSRLLNGRAGNLQALQASSRWNDLDNYPSSNDFNRLGQLMASSDPAISKAANDLATIANNISASKANGWTTPAGMVPPASAMPQPTGASTNSQQPTANSQFSPDDALAVLGRLAKSINHHINTGDFTPNAGAISKYQARKADIAALKDPQLDQFCQEIDASLAAGNQKNVSKVPPPSQAWQQAHMPQMPAGGLGGLLGALFGAMGGGQGGGAPQPAIKGKFSGQTWIPFSAPSPWAAQIQAANANHPAATDPNWFKDQADKLTPKQAVQDMEARGDIVKGGYRDSLDANDPDEQELWAGWSPSKALSDDTARCCSVCFEDLRKRFPNMPWKANLEMRCGTKPMTGGQSTHTQDWRRHTVLFNCDYGNIWPSTGLGKANYGHADARFPFDVLRHEMGHALISGQLPNGKRMISKWHDAMTAAYGNPAKDLEAFAGRYVSSYAVTQKGRGFSMAECLSECFSLATSPDYQPGYLPPPVEDFIFKEMLGM